MSEENDNKPKIKKGIVGIILALIALAMYVSIVYKLKYLGP